MIGVGDPKSVEFVLGPRIHSWIFLAAGGDDAAGVVTLAGGTSVGAAIRVSGSFRLLPEFTVLYPFLGAAGVRSGEDSASGSAAGVADFVLYQGSVGLLFEL